MLIECDAWTLSQERYNARWVMEKHVGIVLRNFHKVVEGARRMLEPVRLAEVRKNVAAGENRAIFEYPEMLAGLLAKSNEAGKPSWDAVATHTPSTV